MGLVCAIENLFNGLHTVFITKETHLLHVRFQITASIIPLNSDLTTKRNSLFYFNFNK